MVSTGFDIIDAVGGIPEKSNVLLISPPGTEKMTFSLRLLGQHLRTGGKGVYVTTDTFPGEIEASSKEIADISAYTNKSLWFVDCYSWTLGEGAQQTAQTAKTARKDIFVPGPSALNDLSIGIAQSLRNAGENPRLVFHSLSTLLLYNNPEIVFRFMQITGARLKAANAITLFHCEEGMHDEKTVSTLKHLSDHVIEIRHEDGKRSIRSSSIGLHDWKELKF